MMSNELKPCPFCGGEARFVQVARGTAENASCRLQFAIRCVKCDATAPHAYGSVYVQLGEDGTLTSWGDDRLEAIEAWNRRVEPNTAVEGKTEMDEEEWRNRLMK